MKLYFKVITLIFFFAPTSLLAQPLPTAEIISNDTSICEAGNAKLKVALTGTPPFVIRYKQDVSTFTSGSINSYTANIELLFNSTDKPQVELLAVYDDNYQTSGGTILGDPMNVTVDARPTVVDAGASKSICGYEINLNANVQGTTTNINWTDATSSGVFNDASLISPQYSNGTAGTYTLTLNVENGACVNSDDVEVTLKGRPQGAITDGSTVSFCSTDAIANSIDIDVNFIGVAPFTYNLENSDGSNTYGTFTSAGASNTESIIVSQSETISLLSIEDGQGCSAIAADMTGSKPILDAKPSVNAGTDKITNCGDEYTLVASASPGTTGAWTSTHSDIFFSEASNANSKVNINFEINDTFKDATLRWTETTTDALSCSDYEEIEIKFVQNPKLAITSVVEDQICEDKSITLNLSASGSKPLELEYNIGGSTITQSLTDVSPTLTVLGSDLDIGNNTINITKISDNFDCFIDYNNISQDVLVDAKPLPDAGFDNATCSKTVELDAESPIVGTGKWTGTPGVFMNDTDPKTSFTANNFDANPDEGQILTWTITNGKCIESDDVLIKFHKAPWPVFAGKDTIIYHVNNFQLQAATPEAGNTYHWDILKGGENITSIPSEPDDILSDLKNGEYQLKWTVSLAANNMCASVTDTVTIQVKPLFSPTGISPNGDDINDYLVIKGVDHISNNKLSVFNKYGKLVFESSNYENDWAGTDIGGSDLPAGTYFYVFEGDELGTPIKDYLIIKRN